MKQRSCIKGKVMMIFLFSQKVGFDLSCELSPTETVCMGCQTFFLSFLFYGGGGGVKNLTLNLFYFLG